MSKRYRSKCCVRIIQTSSTLLIHVWKLIASTRNSASQVLGDLRSESVKSYIGKLSKAIGKVFYEMKQFGLKNVPNMWGFSFP